MLDCNTGLQDLTANNQIPIAQLKFEEFACPTHALLFDVLADLQSFANAQKLGSHFIKGTADRFQPRIIVNTPTQNFAKCDQALRVNF